MIRLEWKRLMWSCRLVIIAGALPVAILIAGLLGFRINFTPSEPLGLWRIVPLGRPAVDGDLVFVCPPQTDEMREAHARGYLRSGLCPGGYAPLIKTIAASPGETVSIGRGVTIDGHELSHSILVPKDGKGRRLLPAAGGTVPDGSVFLHSDFIGSYDSRYFGPVPAAGILGRAEKVLTYAP